MSIYQKNKNILSRYDTTSKGSKIVKYSLTKDDGTSITMICMNGESIDRAREIAKRQFGGAIDIIKG